MRGDRSVGRREWAQGFAEQVVLLEMRQQMEKEGAKHAVLTGWIIPDARRQVFLLVVIVVRCQAELFQVVDALSPTGGLANSLHRRHQETDQDGDDGDDDEQLDEREAKPRVDCS